MFPGRFNTRLRTSRPLPRLRIMTSNGLSSGGGRGRFAAGRFAILGIVQYYERSGEGAGGRVGQAAVSEEVSTNHGRDVICLRVASIDIVVDKST